VTPTVAGAVPAVSAAPDSLELATAPEGFAVHLDNFEGPFDLLLGLISKHKLDVTEVALSQVTDEFIGYIRSRGDDWDLEAATHFLVVAATLLDLKAARLLPAGDVEDEDDLALLEARDLLFARLLQYRAYKDVSADLARRMADAGRRYPRVADLEPTLAQLLPEVLIGLGPDAFAALAARAMAPRPEPVVSITHIHAPRVSVRDQAALLVERLRRARTLSFRVLVADAEDTVVVVARFLALLELYREAAVAFDQMQPMGELTVRWTGAEEGSLDVHDEFDGDPQDDEANESSTAQGDEL
jgi:segregation and condensation protein A